MQSLPLGSAEEGPNSLNLKVDIETTGTVEVKSLTSLVNSEPLESLLTNNMQKAVGSTHGNLNSKPIPVYNIDGMLNEAGSITKVIDLILRYKTHSEQTLFAIINLGKQKLILGHSWLCKHNPEIDWSQAKSRCLDVHPVAALAAGKSLARNRLCGWLRSTGWKPVPLVLCQNYLLIQMTRTC